MWRVLENRVRFHNDSVSKASKTDNEEIVLAVMRFENHAKTFAEWAGNNCGENSIIVLQRANGLLEEKLHPNQKKWLTVKIYQPLALKERGKKW